MAREQLFGSASAQRGAHLVEHLFLRGNLSLLGQVPGSTQCAATRDNRYLDERVGVLQVPRDGGVTRFVQGDGTFLVLGHHLGLLLQTAYDAVHGRDEIVLSYTLLAVACRYQRRLVAHIGDVGTAEAGRLTCQQVDVEGFIYFNGFQVYFEHSLALVQVGQIHVNLTVETSGAQQRLV